MQPATTATLHLPGPQAAAVLGVSLRTLQRQAERGLIPRHLIGRNTLYAVQPPPDLDNAATVTTATAPVAPRAVAAKARHSNDAGAGLVEALVQAVERATAAERDAATARAELANVRAHLDTERREVATLRAELTAAWVELDATRRGWVEALASAPRTP